MLVDFARGSLLAKARQQPEKVGEALQKIRTDGLRTTIEAVRSKLDQPMALGYCNVGYVIETGAGVKGLRVGDRVVSNGKHAEIVVVPQMICARVPDVVENDSAAFTVLGAVALQSLRLAAPTLGECFVVTGLGLVGLLTVQILRANGCRVLGIDPDPSRLDIARRFGAETVNLSAGEDPLAQAAAFSRGRGVDGVLLAASTKSNKPVSEAARMCRQRGRIILVGVAGLELNRSEFYQKEISFQVSCSYGPGRYDPDYEDRGYDYPFGLVRWTEQRNFQAVLDMLADRRLDVVSLISHRFPIASAEKAYELVSGREGSLGILLEYPDEKAAPTEALLRTSVALTPAVAPASRIATVSFIGAGNHATRVLMPAFKAAGAVLRQVASNGGVSGVHSGRKFGFAEATTDSMRVLHDPEVAAVVIASRHDSHARFVIEALQAGKHAFVEKPLCLTEDELARIETTWRAVHADGKGPLLMVGFNRRFAPQVQKIQQLLRDTAGPKSFIMTVNAGAIPAEHWTQDDVQGGGRIIGEACHFIDLLRFLAGSPIVAHHRTVLAGATGDTATLDLSFGDGSIGTVHYFANGNRSFPKERLEVFCNGRVLQLDNFRKLRGFGWPGFRAMNLWSQDKGHRACAAAFMSAVGGAPPIPVDEILEVSRISIALARS